jgi:hypothetical protein
MGCSSAASRRELSVENSFYEMEEIISERRVKNHNYGRFIISNLLSPNRPVSLFSEVAHQDGFATLQGPQSLPAAFKTRLACTSTASHLPTICANFL